MKKIPELSGRLKWLAGAIKTKSFADIGTDHAYVPIYLAALGKVSKAIAADINKGPLEKAESNIKSYGFDELIECRLSDGLKKINPAEVETVLIAGMGGMLICDILEEDVQKTRSFDRIILSPHSDWRNVRECLIRLNLEILSEDMTFDEGKYYLLIETSAKSPGNQDYKGKSELETDIFLEYGKDLILSKNPVLKEFLQKSESNFLNIYESMKGRSSAGEGKVRSEIEKIKSALELMK